MSGGQGMRPWVKRIIIGLACFNGLQLVAWSVLFYPSITVWLKSTPWIVIMSWYANFAASIAALGTSIIMLEQLRRDRQENGK